MVEEALGGDWAGRGRTRVAGTVLMAGVAGRACEKSVVGRSIVVGISV